MAKVLVGFIGRGEKAYKRGAPETASGYETASYQFPDEEQPGEPTPFFGTALLRYLRNSVGPVDRWLVMGTHGSSWATLAAIVGHDIPEGLKESRKNIDACTRDSTIQDKQLDAWQEGLQNYLNPTQALFRITGPADGPESQLKMWTALLEAIQPGDEVVLDITHAFRHMPVFASFMLSTLRWVRNLKKVDLYYGAYEMVDKGATVSVLHLPLVNELMDVAEAAATYNHTGSYEQILNVMGFKGDLNAEAVVYADELNQPAVEKAKELKSRVNGVDATTIAGSLKAHVEDSLTWVVSSGLARQMAHKAMRACSNGQYSNAIVLLYEAIRVAGCDDSSATVTTTEHNRRKQGWDQVLKSVTDQEKSVLNDVEYLRNAVLHGLPGKTPKVKSALTCPKCFYEIMKKGDSLLDNYLKSKGK